MLEVASVIAQGEDGCLYELFGRKITDRETDAYNAGKASGYKDGHTAGYEKGSADGRSEAWEECAAKHFSGIVTGDGSGTLSVSIPFEPDTIMVHCEDAATIKATSKTNSADYVLGCTFNENTTDVVAGVGYYAHNGGYSQQSSAGGKVTRAEDGTVSISGLKFGTSLQYIGLFASGQRYIVTAEKHTM